MERRHVIGLLGGALASLPSTLRAQERMRRVGVLMAIAASDPEAQRRVKAFEAGWPQLGWVNGRNVQVTYHWSAGDLNNLRIAAAEVVAANPDVILTVGTPVLIALRDATASIPIVFAGVSDPVGAGLVASMARPGNNTTGFANFEPSIGGRWLQALRDVAPHVARVAILRNPSGLERFSRTIESIAPSMGMEALDCKARTADEIQAVIDAFAGEPNAGLIVVPDPSFTAQRRLIVELAAKHRMPAIYPFKSFADDGGLMSYSVNVADQVHRAASYIDRILKGAKAGELPVQAPTKFDLVINLKTAKVLGLAVPTAQLVAADELLE